jgi:hypothetical protein
MSKQETKTLPPAETGNAILASDAVLIKLSTEPNFVSLSHVSAECDPASIISFS